MLCSCGTNGDRARSALRLKRSYMPSVANIGLTNSYKRYGQGHCDQALPASKRLLSLADLLPTKEHTKRRSLQKPS